MASLALEQESCRVSTSGGQATGRDICAYLSRFRETGRSGGFIILHSATFRPLPSVQNVSFSYFVALDCLTVPKRPRLLVEFGTVRRLLLKFSVQIT